MKWLVVGFMLTTSCQRTLAPPLQAPVENAQVYIAADLDGDTNDSLVAIRGDTIHWDDQQHTIDGGVLQWRVGRLNSSRVESIVLLTGRSRTHPNATPKIIEVKKDGVALLYIGDSPKERISDIRASKQGLFVTRVGPDKVARGGWLQDKAIVDEIEATMGLQQVPLASGGVAVGRLYGDQPKEAGRLEIHQTGRSPKIIPTFRGVRSLEVTDLDGDGHQDLLVADGWHFRYGTEAQARLIALMGPDFEERRTLAHIDSAYTINRIEVHATPGHPTPTLLVEASDGHYLIGLDEVSWKATSILPQGPGNSVAIGNTDKQSWIIINGTAESMPQDSH